MKHTIKIIFIFILFTLIIPRLVFASEIRLESQKAKVHLGEQFSVNVLVSGAESLNAIEGKIVFDGNQLMVEDISDGNSVINFWVERPKVKEGKIVFSGATPVGFSGNNQKIFSIKFKAKNEGLAPINIAETEAYINDGNGTKANLILSPTQVLIDGGMIESKEILADKEAPEDFTPFIVKDDSINDNKYSIIFSTQDKASGINKYEIKEGKFSFYKEAESPYLLSDQLLSHDVYVRVIDNNSNKRVVVVPAKNHKPIWMQIDVIKYLFGIIVIIGSLIFIWKRSSKQ